MTRFPGESLYEAGFTDLVSVAPPGAPLAPSSQIKGSQLGKVPATRKSGGLWSGYKWREHQPTLDDVRAWSVAGANLGLRAARFPAVDIDVTDAGLSQIIEDFVLARLGPAPVRTGRAPKRLLLYKTDVPFGRMRLSIERKDEHHLVEVLGSGQQFLVTGIHPSTGRPYVWSEAIDALTPTTLTSITQADADTLLTELAELIDLLGGWKLVREGDGRIAQRNEHTDQGGLAAPSLEILREAVGHIPNTSDLFPDRTSYIKMGYAIRGASGPLEEDGFEIFAEWAAKWEGNDRAPHGNDPEAVRADWRRMRPPYAVGWSYLAEQARGFGFNDAVFDFEPVDDRPDDLVISPVRYSEQWLAEHVIELRRGELRYVPANDQFLVWDGGRWQPDAVLLAEDIVKQELKKVASKLGQTGGSAKETRDAAALATAVCSAGKAAAVRTLLRSDRRIATSPVILDHNPWVINTPGGIINLHTGVVGPPDPDQLCTRSTSVPADFSGTAPEWRRFLGETTGGDRALERYLQKLAGYLLTGSTREQILTFIWGPGGNGKSVFLTALSSILHDYARTANMDTFTATSTERHSTEIAMFHGARLVSASETQAGKRWDEARVKSLTGGEPVSARFMRQDFFTFLPQFKLVFVGNHKPEVRDLDDAMRRRIHMVPFTVTPAVIDRELANKLRAEYPAILAWMVEGCLLWQAEGLAPPEIVRQTTDDYFNEEDVFGRWRRERTDIVPDAETTTQDLYQDWREWANNVGEFPGTLKRFASGLVAMNLVRWRHPETRRMGFSGIQLKPKDQSLGGVL